MDETPTRRQLIATTASLTVLSLSGCLGGDGDDDGSDKEYDVPDASFTVIDQNLGAEPPTITVAHSGDELTQENTGTVEVRSDPGEGEQYTRLGVFDPITEGPIDGMEKTFAGSADDLSPGRTVRFVWISVDGQREAELDTWEVSAG